MNRHRIQIPIARVAILGIALSLLAACGPQLKGKYVAESDQSNMAQAFIGQIEIEFKSGDKANYSIAGNTIEVEYEVNGKEVKLKTGDGTQIGTIDDDGCLQFGGAVGRLCKAKE